MQALWVLGLALSCPALATAHVEWNVPLSDCMPVDLAVSATGQSYVACQQSYGKAAMLYSYGFSGRLAGTHTVTAAPQESLLPRDVLWHDGILYLSLTAQTKEGTQSRLQALEPETLRVLWQVEHAGFVGNNLVGLSDSGLWWLGVNTARDADILASRYTKDGRLEASFQYDSGGNDTLGFDRRSGAAGPDGGLYIGGFSEVLRVSAQGTLLWKADFPSTSVRSRPNGELIVTNLRAPQGFTASFAPDGRELWRLNQGGSVLSLAADQSIWLAGTTVKEDSAGWDLRVLKLSAKGDLQRADLYQGPYQDRAVDIATDASGHAYVLASSYVKSSWFGQADRYLILKYDREGERQWSHLYGVLGLPEALHVTPQGDAYALGGDGTILLRE